MLWWRFGKTDSTWKLCTTKKGQLNNCLFSFSFVESSFPDQKITDRKCGPTVQSPLIKRAKLPVALPVRRTNCPHMICLGFRALECNYNDSVIAFLWMRKFAFVCMLLIIKKWMKQFKIIKYIWKYNFMEENISE